MFYEYVNEEKHIKLSYDISKIVFLNKIKMNVKSAWEFLNYQHFIEIAEIKFIDGTKFIFFPDEIDVDKIKNNIIFNYPEKTNANAFGQLWKYLKTKDLDNVYWFNMDLFEEINNIINYNN